MLYANAYFALFKLLAASRVLLSAYILSYHFIIHDTRVKPFSKRIVFVEICKRKCLRYYTGFTILFLSFFR